MNGDDTLEAASRLESAMLGLSRDFREVEAAGARSRVMIYALAAVVVMMLCAFAWLAVLTHRADEASSDASQARRGQLTACDASNDGRALTRQLWGYVLDESVRPVKGRPVKTKAELAQIAKFRLYVNTTFAARDCVAESS